MRLFKQLLTNNDCYKSGKTIKPKGVMWHSTGANNPKLSRYVQPNDGTLGVNKNGNHWNQAKPGGRRVCVHAFIGQDVYGDVATYQTLPWDMRGWHCGGAANNTHVGFEICEDALNDEVYFKAVYKEACELTAYLCEMFDLDPMEDGVVICHSEGFKRGIATNHSDVMHWFKKFGKTMDDVRKDVKALMRNSEPAPQEPSKPVVDATPDDDSFKVRVVIPDLRIRSGPGTNYAKTGKYTGAGVFTIVDTKPGQGSKKGWAKLKSDAGWISLDYCVRI